jgi:hypothetical protein
MNISRKLRVLFVLTMGALQVLTNSKYAVAQSLPIKNVVLVHGAFVVDCSELIMDAAKGAQEKSK